MTPEYSPKLPDPPKYNDVVYADNNGNLRPETPPPDFSELEPSFIRGQTSSVILPTSQSATITIVERISEETANNTEIPTN